MEREEGRRGGGEEGRRKGEEGEEGERREVASCTWKEEMSLGTREGQKRG